MNVLQDFVPMDAAVLAKPTLFDRVDDIKRAFGATVLSDDDRYRLLGSSLVVMVDGLTHVVPAGFATDAASTKVAQAITAWRPWNPPQLWACVFHDWLYRRAGTSRRYADEALRAVLQAEGSIWWQRQTMFYAARITGRRLYRRLQSAGAWVCEP
jgi:hypothetical protein